MKYLELFEDVSNEKNSSKTALSDEQNLALNSPFNLSAVIHAGAGAGKTRLIIERVALLISRGVNPSKIALITFTRNSAKELKDRIIAKVGPKADKLVVGTIHSVVWSSIARKSAVKDLSISSDLQLLQAVSGFKDILPDSYASFSNSEIYQLFSKKREQQDLDSVAGIYAHQFNDYLSENNLVDFTSVLFLAKSLVSEKFDYMFIDEVQDVSAVQKDLIFKLGGSNVYWMIGDPCQSIYSFRGASIRSMDDLSERIPTKFELTLNYRSDKDIVTWCNNFLLKFPFFKSSPKSAVSPSNGNVSVQPYASSASEFEAACEWAKSLKKGSYSILCRTQKASQEFKNKGIVAHTVHEAKGLEWSNVWVFNCSSTNFPHFLSELEEEACLFYVAASRAKNLLIFSYSDTLTPSNFLI